MYIMFRRTKWAGKLTPQANVAVAIKIYGAATEMGQNNSAPFWKTNLIR